MKPCLLIPKDAPHLCLHVKGEGDRFSFHIIFREILPPNHPCRDKQVWIVEDSLIRLAKNPKMVLYGAVNSSVYLVNQVINLVPQEIILPRFRTFLLKKLKTHDKIQGYFADTVYGICAPEGGMEAGKRVITGKSEEMCGFEFRDVEEHDNNDDFPNELNGQKKKASPTVEKETKPALPAIASITADLSLLFGTESGDQVGTCRAEFSVVKGYSSQSTTISDKLHKELYEGAIKEGSILARKVKGRCKGNVGRMLEKALRVPRDKQEMNFEMTVDLGSPCFVYQVRFDATMTDGTIVECYGGHFITDEAIDLDNDDGGGGGATTESQGERTTASWEGVTVETKVEPYTFQFVTLNQIEGYVFTDESVEGEDNADESHSDSSDRDGVVVE